MDTGGAHAVVDRRMDVLVIHDHISPLWNARKKTHIGVKPGIEQQSSFCTEKLAQAVFELGMGVAIDEETGATGTKDIVGC